MAHNGSDFNVRLGSAEVAILAQLRRAGEPVPRQLLLLLVYAQTSPTSHAASPESQAAVAHLLPSGRTRQNAESTLSRALRSLERKGLIVRSVSESTRRTHISTARPVAGWKWERNAVAEEEFATRCDALSAELGELARNARTRALRIHTKRAPMSTLPDWQRRHAAAVPFATSS